jgi:HSP20 family molecular chaperone IbpA
MNNATRRAAFDDFFSDYFGKVLFMPAFACPADTELKIKIDVSEADRDFTVLAEIPGVRKEDIAVEIDGDAEEKDGETTIYSERGYGYVAQLQLARRSRWGRGKRRVQERHTATHVAEEGGRRAPRRGFLNDAASFTP